MQEHRAYWRKLDHVAKMYSATSNDKITRVFRFYCVLKEDIQPIILQEALNKTIETYPIFLSVMRKGLFWHYLEKSSLRPVVKEESKEVCSTLYVHDQKSLLFEVTYYHNRINFEVFHALTDGTGATAFLKEIIKNYLYLSHLGELEEIHFLGEHITIQDQESDGFSKYYRKEKVNKTKKIKAYQIIKPQKQRGSLQVNESSVYVKDIQKKAKKKKVSLSIYITSLLLMAISREMNVEQEKRPVVLHVPVNLRKFFPTESMLNFFVCMNPKYTFCENTTLDDVIQQVQQYYQKELTKERIIENMNRFITLEKHPLLRIVPLEVKNLSIKAGTIYAEKDATAVYSNMGIIDMPDSYAKYIERFGVFTNTPKLELCMCSFQGQITFSFTSTFDTRNIQRNFYQILKEEGVPVTLIKPDYPDLKKQSENEKKWYRIYTFICLSIVVICFGIEGMMNLRTHWAFYVVGAISSVWLCSYVGYKKRRNLLKNAMWQLILLSFGSFIWDLCIGYYRWSINFVIPVLCMINLLFMIVVAKARKDAPSEYMVYLVMGCLYGSIVPIILIITKMAKFKSLNAISMIFSIIFLLGLIVFKGKEFKEEMIKKLHV